MKKEKNQEEAFGKHAEPVSGHISEAIDKGSISLYTDEDLDKFIEGIQGVQQEKTGRASSLNLLNINNGKNTLEFRLANGSIDPNTWIENIRLFGRCVEMAEKLAQIEKKNEGELSKEDKNLINLKELLKQKKPEREKMEILLELLFTEEERIVYRDRYDRNSEELSVEDNPLNGLKFADKVDFHKIDEFSYISRHNRGGYIDVTTETRGAVEAERRGEDIIGRTEEKGEKYD